MAMDFPNSPTVNQTFTVGDKTWKWTGTAWEIVVNRPAMRSVADTPPANPIVGDEWFNSLTGRTYTWFDSYWVEVNTNSVVGASGLNGVASASAPLAYDSGSNTISVQSSPTFSGTLTAPTIATSAGRLTVKGSSSDTSGVLELQSYDGVKNYVYKTNGGGLNLTTQAGIAVTAGTNGNVRLPFQPAIFLDGNYSAWETNANNVSVKRLTPRSNARGGFVWDSSTGRLTVPVTGWYAMTYVTYQAGATALRLFLRSNTGTFAMRHTYEAGDGQTMISGLVYANANDWLDIFLETAVGCYYGPNHTFATVHFLG